MRSSRSLYAVQKEWEQLKVNCYYFSILLVLEFPFDGKENPYTSK